jgi:hypothetical protein
LLAQEPRELLHEERVALGPCRHQIAQRTRLRSGQQRLGHARRVGGGELLERQPLMEVAILPGRRVAGSICTKQEEASVGERTGQGMERLFRAAVDPLQILHEQQLRPFVAAAKHQPFHRFERPLLALRLIQALRFEFRRRQRE